MKISRRTFAYMCLTACLCLVGFVLPVGGQAPAAGEGVEAAAPGQGILGTLDPQTGAFKPVIKPTMVEDLETAPLATAATTGTFKVNFTISVKSTIPSADVISCGVNASTFDVTSSHSIVETAAVAASRAGSSATCSVTIPYSWVLVSPTTDMVTLSYAIQTPFGGSTLLPARLSSQTISTGHIPTSGATTTVSVAATI